MAAGHESGWSGKPQEPHLPSATTLKETPGPPDEQDFSFWILYGA